MVDSMRCLLVTKREDGKVERAITNRPTSEFARRRCAWCGSDILR